MTGRQDSGSRRQEKTLPVSGCQLPVAGKKGRIEELEIRKQEAGTGSRGLRKRIVPPPASLEERPSALRSASLGAVKIEKTLLVNGYSLLVGDLNPLLSLARFARARRVRRESTIFLKYKHWILQVIHFRVFSAYPAGGWGTFIRL
jgi:hypothetical protein